MTHYAPPSRRDFHVDITAKIIAELEAGTVPWLKPWATMTTGYIGLPRNAVSRRRYSGVNVIILWMAQFERGYASSEWITFRQALERGGHVRAGEKGTQVVLLKRATKKIENEDGEEVDKNYSLLRSYTVFNVEQCDNLKLAGAKLASDFTPKATASGLNAAFEDAVRRTGIAVRHGGDSAHYTPITDHIQMPQLEQFKDAASYMVTKAHELIHATGHKSRLAREGIITPGTKKTPAIYAFEELIAEIGAAFTCAEFGITGELRHADYIKHFLALLKADKKAIVLAASKASRAVSFLYPATAEDYDEETEAAA